MSTEIIVVGGIVLVMIGLAVGAKFWRGKKTDA